MCVNLQHFVTERDMQDFVLKSVNNYICSNFADQILFLQKPMQIITNLGVYYLSYAHTSYFVCV